MLSIIHDSLAELQKAKLHTTLYFSIFMGHQVKSLHLFAFMSQVSRGLTENMEPGGMSSKVGPEPKNLHSTTKTWKEDRLHIHKRGKTPFTVTETIDEQRISRR